MSRMVADSYYEYINKHSISKHLKCTICDNPFIDPVKTGCKPKEHVYCNQCITQWLKRISECPSCRSPLQKKDLKTVTENIVLDILNELPVQCKLCGQQGIERGDFYVHHTKLCPVANVPDASADTESLKSESSDESNTDSQTISRKELPSAYIDIKANNKHQQLTKHVNQQKLEIPNPQNENEQSKVRPEPPKSPRPLPSSNSPRPLSSSNSPLPGKFLRPNVGKSMSRFKII